MLDMNMLLVINFTRVDCITPLVSVKKDKRWANFSMDIL